MKARLLLAAVAAVPAACTTLQNQSRVDPRTVIVYSQGAFANATCPQGRIPGDTWDGATSTACMNIVGDDLTDVNAYKAAVLSADMRNRVAEQLMKQSDDICTVEMGRLTGDEAIANTLLSTATSGFSIASAAIKTQWLSTVLAGLGSFTNSTRDHIRAEIYRNFMSYELIKAIAAARTTKLQQIRSNYGETKTAYNVDAMIRDVNEYHHLCSLSMGFTLVDAAVSKSGPDSSSRRDALTIAINDLDARINQLKAEIPKAPASARDALQTQLSALVQQQTELYQSRAAATTGTEKVPQAPSDQNPGTGGAAPETGAAAAQSKKKTKP